MSDKQSDHSNDKEVDKSKSQRPATSRIAIIGTAVGSVIGIFGAFIGAFELFSLWGGGTYFPG
ncbi:MAG: hypothetical protein ACRECH_14215, partial [Nitrososphaerales archaeon]